MLCFRVVRSVMFVKGFVDLGWCSELEVVAFVWFRGLLVVLRRALSCCVGGCSPGSVL